MNETQNCKLFIKGYLIDLTRVANTILSEHYLENNKKLVILIEAPPGMLQFLRVIRDKVKECIKDYKGASIPASFLARLDPAFGSCDIGIDYALRYGVNVIIHIGHTPYPYRYYVGGNYTDTNGLGEAYGVRIVFVNAEYTEYDASRLHNTVLEFVKQNNLRRIVFSYTAQHIKLAKTLIKILKSKGFEAIDSGIVLGCYYYNVINMKSSSDAYMVISGGIFHPLGLGLAIGTDKPIIHLDPYTARIKIINQEVEKLLKIRYNVIFKALEAKKYAIIVGSKLGQYRPWIITYLKKLIESKGLKAYLLASSTLNRESLDNLAPQDYDAYIVTSCPRVAIDDLADYWKPVLTPGEARMILTNNLEKYLFPW